MSPAFVEFMELLGDSIELKGWKGFTGGLSTFGSDGDNSYYTNFEDKEIMFHVGPLIPNW